MAPVVVFLNNRTHIHSSELQYAAALVQNQFWHHSPFIAHNYGIIYANKTS